MISKSILVIGCTAALFASLTVASSAFIADVSGETPLTEKQTGPRYSETCAHGHNGFDCKPSSIRSDIDDLQKRVTELEKRN